MGNSCRGETPARAEKLIFNTSIFFYIVSTNTNASVVSHSMLTRLIFSLLGLLMIVNLFNSCTSAGIKITGAYNSKKTYLRSSLNIKEDKSFYYINEGLPLYIKGEYFYYTIGSWTKQDDTLFLNSYSVPITKDTASITDNKINSLKSTFTFFSPEGDTLPFNRVDKNSNNLAWIVHSNYKSGEYDVKQGDSLTFWFDYGFSPATIIILKSDNRNYKIRLQRKFLSAHFKSSKFLIKKNKLIELATREKYIQTKNGL